MRGGGHFRPIESHEDYPHVERALGRGRGRGNRVQQTLAQPQSVNSFHQNIPTPQCEQSDERCHFRPIELHEENSHVERGLGRGRVRGRGNRVQQALAQPQSENLFHQNIPSPQHEQLGERCEQRAPVLQQLSSQRQAQYQQQPPGKEHISAQLQQLSITTCSGGTKGIKHIIETNYFALIVDNIKECAYHYDVTVIPDKPKRLLKIVFDKFNQENYSNIAIAFDSKKNAYSPVLLDLKKPLHEQITIIDEETGQNRVFTVNIKEVNDNQINLSCLKSYNKSGQMDVSFRAIQCIDIILKQSLRNGVQIGRSFFPRPCERPKDLGDFCELWTGLFQSAILGRIPYVNIDVAHKAFVTPLPVIEIMGQLKRQMNYGMFLEQLERYLKNLSIVYKIYGKDKSISYKTYKVLSVGKTPDIESFLIDDKRITVLDYFKTKGIKLQYPTFPCILAGHSKNPLALPPEFCQIASGQVKKKCTEQQTRAMIFEAATRTDVRKQKIVDLLNKLKPNTSTALQQFGLNLSRTFANVNARVIDTPMLEYGEGRTVKPAFGKWQADRNTFITPQKPTVWGVLVLTRIEKREVDNFCDALIKCASRNGMKLPRCSFVQNLPRNVQIKEFLDSLKTWQPNIIFCIIPNNGNTYAQLKQAAELECGILTQCVKQLTIRKINGNDQTVFNILLKVNAKLNGTNHKLRNTPVLRENYMVIGADVTHPSPEMSHIPSVVGVCGSHDVNAFKYYMSWRLQDPRMEIIQDFKEILMKQLNYYREKNQNQLPTNILYYRDGVSEGQFKEAINVELKAMYEACNAIQPGYGNRVKITMIVVQKRHHTRFFPGNSGIGDSKNNNVPPGTIVDTEIVHPKEKQFFLVSHQSIQGVAKPTKYCVLRDDANINIDDLQALTFNLCHLFTRCNRSVSYPAPTYYAHLIAARGKVYIEGQTLNMDKLDEDYLKRKLQDIIVEQHPMFFV